MSAAGREVLRRVAGDPRPLLAIALFCSALVYVQTLSYGFVYDDIPLIVDNPLIRDAGNALRFFTQEDFLDGVRTGYYRPLIPFFSLADHLVWGLDPLGYHLTNVLLHLGVVTLVFFLARRLLTEPAAALAAALFVGLHPVNTESVSFITGRNNVICALFIVASVLAYLRYRDGRGRIWFASSLLLFFFGLLSKEFAFIVPAVVVALDAAERRLQGRDVRRYLPFLAPAAVYLVMRAAALGDPIGVPAAGTDLLGRLRDSAGILAAYVRLSVLPFGQKALYDARSITSGQTLAGMAVLAGVVLLLVRMRRRRWAPAAGVWYFLALLPVLNVIPLSGSPMAERYLYVPLIGMAIGFGGLTDAATDARTSARTRAAAAVLLAVFALLTVLRNPVWKSEEALYRDMIRTTPTAYKGYYDLGHVRYKQGDREGAARLWEKVLAVRPDMMAVHNNLGVLYEEAGDLARAEAHFRAVLDVRSMAEVYRNLGNVLAKQGKDGEAGEAYRRAIALEPRNMAYHTALISYYESRRSSGQALDAALAAVRQMPDSAAAHNVAGTVYGALKRYEDAHRHFQKAVELDPRCFECSYNLTAVRRMGVR